MTTFGKIFVLCAVLILGISAAWVWNYQRIQKKIRPVIVEVATTTPVYVRSATSTEAEVYETAIAFKTDIFKTVSVATGALIKPKTKVTGEVRGNWFFEGSFPAELRVGTSTILWSGVAQAQGSWMTTNFVPFTMNISYTALGTTTPATLILKKDNPSGEPINDDELQIAVMVQ